MTGHTRALLAEAAGTFMFFFIGAGAIVATGGADLVAIALAHGLSLAVAVSSFGALSGGHFNPAVTFGLAVAGKHPWPRVATYSVAQTAGALVAGFALRYAFEFDPSALSRTHVGTPALGGGVSAAAGIVVEAILTLFLLWAVFGTAVSPLAPRIAGFGIGLAVAADILVGGPITGAAMNPARWLGPAVAAGFYQDWYVYFVGPLVGAALAGLSYRYAFAPPEGRAPATPVAPRA
ncbi:MAG TPA: aquaporin [Candidatus Limnocylindria bacterium]|jgi:aquaporin Z|nr:aquaporin [Candidatus Limnocylindria bacterium]